MDKQLSRSLVPLVNDKEKYDSLKDYAKARIWQMHVLLETTKDHHRILEIQGSINELKRMDTLRDEVLKGSE